MKSRIVIALAAVISTVAFLPKAVIAQEIPTTLRQEMPYAQARQILLDAGWQAVYRSPMRERFGAMDYMIDELGYHEVVNCSGTGLGFCGFQFTDAYGRRLSITTVNNYPRFGEPTVYAWQLEEDEASNAYNASSGNGQSTAHNTCRSQVKPETNVRTGPSTGSGIIATLRPPLNQDAITVHSTRIGRDGQSWSWITFGSDETAGWVRSDLVVCR